MPHMGLWRVNAASTAAAKAEKLISGSSSGQQKRLRLLGFSAHQYAAATAAGTAVVLTEGDQGSSGHTSSATVGVIGTATEMVPVESYSSAGLAVSQYVSVEFSASAPLSTQYVQIWGDYV